MELNNVCDTFVFFEASGVELRLSLVSDFAGRTWPGHLSLIPNFVSKLVSTGYFKPI